MDPSLLNYAGPSNYAFGVQQPSSSSSSSQQTTTYSRIPQTIPPGAVPTSSVYPSNTAGGSYASSPSSAGTHSPGHNAASRGLGGQQIHHGMAQDVHNGQIAGNGYSNGHNHNHSNGNGNGNGNGTGTGGGTGLGPLVEPHQDLQDFLESFWTKQMESVEREEQDGKVSVSLPLARIKKVMKSDEEVKMISAEVPIMFSKACEVFISELTCRAWLVAESHKRRTLQKSDVAAAIAHSDMFDFLIDIVPRDGEGGGDGADGADAGEADGGDGGDDAGREGEGETLAPSLDEEDGGEGDEGEELYREFVEGDE